MASPWGGGQAGQLAPLHPPQIGHPVRSMQIRGDFRIRKKMGVGLQDLLRRFNAPTLRWTFFGLTITKKEGVVEVIEALKELLW